MRVCPLRAVSTLFACYFIRSRGYTVLSFIVRASYELTIVFLYSQRERGVRARVLFFYVLFFFFYVSEIMRNQLAAPKTPVFVPIQIHWRTCLYIMLSRADVVPPESGITDCVTSASAVRRRTVVNRGLHVFRKSRQIIHSCQLYVKINYRAK